MGQVNISLPSDGTTADVSDYNTPLTTIVDEVNGNLDNSNISASAAIAGSKIASGGIGPTQLTDGVVVQVASVAYSAVATGTTTIPLDDTIPQNTEGTEFMTLAITPKSATNILVISVEAMLNPSVSVNIISALFQDTTANAIAANRTFQATNGGTSLITLRTRMVAGTTSATTFKFRAGGSSASTLTFNGSGGTREFGAITKSSIVITEYKAS